MTTNHPDDVVVDDSVVENDSPTTNDDNDEWDTEPTTSDDSDEGDTVTVDLYNAAHGKAPRTGGPYQDELIAEQAELRRSKLEDRDPDLENPPATAATVLVPKDYLVERDTDKSHFSDRVELQNEPVGSYEVQAVEDKPDPRQVDWNNDMSVVNAANAKVSLQQAEKNKDDDELSDEQKTVLKSEAARSSDEKARYTAPDAADKQKNDLSDAEKTKFGSEDQTTADLIPQSVSPERKDAGDSQDWDDTSKSDNE